jgi:hypothetical protein
MSLNKKRSGWTKHTSHAATALVGVMVGAITTYLIVGDPKSSELENVTTSGPVSQAEAAPSKPVVAEAPSPAIKQEIEIAALPKEEIEDAVKAASPASSPLDASAPKLPERFHRSVEIKRGDTLMDVVVTAGAERREAHAAITALRKVFDPRKLRPGHKLNLIFEAIEGSAGEDDRTERLIDLSFDESVERRVLASLGTDGFKGLEILHPLSRRMNNAKLTIEDSLFLAADRAGMPAGIIIDLIHLYSFDVDFQRDIQPGDQFEVFYETFHTADGGFARSGEILFAALHTGGTILPLYRFKMADGDIDYFNNKGESVRKALMKTPIDGARLSSRFGRRKHPTLGYTKMHRGIDFAASKGTPIMAAGSGTVKFAGRKGTYGKYIRIRHNSEFSTAYAHMSGYARGIKTGKRVKQGQIIGYVGTTGRSTGPHLHYEILRNSRQINPLGLKLPTGKKLKGKEVARFKIIRDKIAADYAAIPQAQPIKEAEKTD